LKRLLTAALAFVLLFLPLAVRAADYTDIWYLPAESGWGVNMVQSDNFIFATFFIYGPNNTPTWYTAQMSAQANGNFAGSLYATVGTYFGAPWDPAKVATTLAGTASFVPASLYQGTLTYSLTGGPTVTKTIQRQVLTAIPLAGQYFGGRVGAYSGGGCAMPGGYQDTFNLQVSQAGNVSASFQFSFTGGVTCTLSGALAQYGQLYSIPSATYQCSNGLNTTARMDGIQATARGIQGSYAAPAAAGGCAENATFTSVAGTHTVAAAPNVAPLYVDAGPASVANILFVTVTVCAPGSNNNCQTIDHIQVDTGSSGLRLMSSVLSPALSLPQQVDGSGNPIVECVQFVDGFSWGPVKTADLHIAGEKAPSMSVQIIGDPAFSTIPGSCSSSGPPENDVMSFGANGLIGIGLFLHDCGNGCAVSAPSGFYYSCPAAGCFPTSVPVAQQLANPVALFSGDNNGSLIALNQIPASGAATASGSLIFGIGTQANNGLGKATVIATDPSTGYIITNFNNQNYTTSFVDSGSTLLFISTALYPLCTNAASGWYCPPTTQQLSATLEGNNQAVAHFSIANGDALLGANPNFYAFNDLASPGGDVTVFDWGIPFFYGRSVFTAIENRNTPAGAGPYIAF
jgi:hypothetical protein